MDQTLSQTVGVILAGGAGQRMGGVMKPLLPLAPGTLFSWCQQRAQPQVRQLALSVHDSDALGGLEAVKQRFGFDGPILCDDSAALADDKGGRVGPLAGFLAALRWAKDQGAVWVALFPGDTPFIPLDLVLRLQGAAQSTGALCAYARSCGRDHPAVALLHVTLELQLCHALEQGERRLWRWLNGQGAQTADWNAATLANGGNELIDPFWNMNTPEDLKSAQALVVHCTP